MRLVVGSALVVRASSTLLSDPPPRIVTIPAIFLVAGGILLIAGLWTPIAGVSVALTETSKMLMLHGDKSGWLVLGAVGAALAMQGPGLWSVDARLYGWKRLEATPRKKTSHPAKNSRED